MVPPASALTVQPAGAAVHAGATPDEAQRVAAGFEALLFRIALEPLAKPLGFFGEVAVDALAGAVARGPGDGLRARIEALVDAAR